MRELSDVDAREQAAALHAHVSRGGAASRWLDSKGFGAEDRAAIVLALSDLDQETDAETLQRIASGVRAEMLVSVASTGREEE